MEKRFHEELEVQGKTNTIGINQIVILKEILVKFYKLTSYEQILRPL
jgi:hypothetical protein